MSDKTRAAMQKALNLIEGEWPEDDEIAQSVINEIREALEQPVSQEPIAEVKVQKIEGGPAFHYIDCQHLPPGTNLYLAPQPVSQEPVAWMHGIDRDPDDRESFMVYYKRTPGYCIPLYAAPVRTKDLTDDEISDAIHGKGSPLRLHDYAIRDFRAVIAADRSKNK